MDKETLRQYQDLQAEIRELKQQRQDIIASLGEVPALSNLPKSKGTKSDPTAKIAIKLAKLQRLIDDKKLQCLELCTEIEKNIGALPSRERRVMRLRYIRGLSWPRVTESIYGQRGDYFDRYDNYLQRVYYLHGTGLKRIKNFYTWL